MLSDRQEPVSSLDRITNRHIANGATARVHAAAGRLCSLAGSRSDMSLTLVGRRGGVGPISRPAPNPHARSAVLVATAPRRRSGLPPETRDRDRTDQVPAQLGELLLAPSATARA